MARRGRHRSVGHDGLVAVSGGTEYFGQSGQQWMLNYRIDELDALLEQLQREGVEVLPRRDNADFGKFGWIVDPEGNRVELWEAPKKKLSENS